MTNGSKESVVIGFVLLKVLRTLRKKEREYPLVDRAENNTFVAFKKSACLVHMRWKLSSCDLTRPAYVCLGLKLVLKRRACVYWFR